MTFPATAGLPLILTDGQEDAFARITEAFGDAGAVVTLCGYAGTGKTTLIGLLTQWLSGEEIPYLLCAPTHKALRQLEKGQPPGQAKVTLASLLSKKRKRDFKGGWTFESQNPPSVIRARFEHLEDGGIIIIDEASMISEADAELIIEIFQPFGTTVLFCGDYRQLPPVDEVQTPLMSLGDDCPLAEVVCSLTEVVRHDGPILELATALRTVPFGVVPFGAYAKAPVRLVTSKEQWEADWLGWADPDAVTALAFTNKRVAELNQLMLQHVYGDAAHLYHCGQRLLTVEGVSNEDNTGLLFPSTTEVIIRGTESALRPVGEHLESVLPYEVLDVYAPATGTTGLLNVVAVGHLPIYEAELKRLKALALEDRALWKYYYRFAEAFTAVQPAYALTVHKSQGSTYTDVFLDINDITTNSRRDLKMTNRLAYVGVSRAQRSLNLLV